MHKNLSANSKRKIDFIQRKSAALALPLQALQVRPYRMVCKRFRELFSSWADSSSSWLSLESSPIHHHYHSLRFPPRHFISVEISESMDRSALVVPSWVITFVFANSLCDCYGFLSKKRRSMWPEQLTSSRRLRQIYRRERLVRRRICVETSSRNLEKENRNGR